MHKYIETNEILNEVCEGLNKEKELGVDLECENNMHHYGAYLSLIQISDSKSNYIIDILKITEFQPLIDVLENKKILKIFHGVDFDFRMLNHQLKCHPKNIFDTQVAAQLLGKEKIGLGDLIEEYFNVKKIKKFQKADWTRRPLTEGMLDYASGDTIYLIRLKDIMRKELAEKSVWADQEFLDLEKRDWPYEEGTFNTVRGYAHLTPKERAIFRRLYTLRDNLAKQVDKPVHFVINNKTLIEFTIKPPKEWSKLRGVHPIVKRNAKLFSEEVSKGNKEELYIPEKEIKHFSHKERELFRNLGELQIKIGTKLGIKPHLVMNKEQIIDIVINGNLNSLRDWQKKLVEEDWKKIK